VTASATGDCVGNVGRIGGGDVNRKRRRGGVGVSVGQSRGDDVVDGKLRLGAK
jgi:hypothetical protein